MPGHRDVGIGEMSLELLELQTSLIESLEQPDFVTLQKLALDCKSLLWLDALDDACSGLFTGMARVLRNEVPGLQLRTMHMPPDSLSSAAKMSSLIVRLWESDSPDNEFRVQDDVVHISRIVEDEDLNDNFSNSAGSESSKVDAMVLCEDSIPLELSVQKKGFPCFVPISTSTAQLGEDEIEVSIRAVAFR